MLILMDESWDWNKMRDIEKKKLQVEMMKVQAAKADMEYKILERMEDIERIKENIKVQENREQELRELLKES